MSKRSYYNRAYLVTVGIHVRKLYVISLIIEIFPASPLLSVAGSGTSKTERRRSRSRSRQKIDIKFVQKVDEIPIIHDTIEYLLSTYSLIKVATV